MKLTRTLATACAVTIMCAASTAAQEVRITPDIDFFEVRVGDRVVIIERIQDTSNRLENDFTKTSRQCPPFCIHPMKAADGVETIGEVEVLEFIRNKVATGEGYLVDARVPEWFEKGAIPSSINIPFTVLDPENDYVEDILLALGAVKSDDGSMDFAEAKELALYCNGPWCDQSPRAIQNLISMGYPPEKLQYYRGGMQSWQILGLNTDPAR